MSTGIAALLVQSVQSFISIYSVLLIVRVLLTWFQTASWAQQIMEFLSPITDPYLNIFRSFIPALGGIDFSPMIAILALSFIGNALVSLLASLLLTNSYSAFGV
ncbi:YggT family protein [Spirulina sp. CS-785/01]|uniref:YggT family protein n=1 Tax=Spirulina sp. CS-785/01 TaxID=3021716 RepID=UPI00232CFA14|nr:YggT family protein [Spirulina sp. CS-785/01]MDB9315133.1 YggT family protein [Spirulina sp. CS-785/01]